MDWRKAARAVYHDVLGIDKCPAEINDRDEALREAVSIAQNRRTFFFDNARLSPIQQLGNDCECPSL